MADLMETDVFRVQHVDYSFNKFHAFNCLKSMQCRVHFEISYMILESDRPLSERGHIFHTRQCVHRQPGIIFICKTTVKLYRPLYIATI